MPPRPSRPQLNHSGLNDSMKWKWQLHYTPFKQVSNKQNASNNKYLLIPVKFNFLIKWNRYNSRNSWNIYIVYNKIFLPFWEEKFMKRNIPIVYVNAKANFTDKFAVFRASHMGSVTGPQTWFILLQGIWGLGLFPHPQKAPHFVSNLNPKIFVVIKILKILFINKDLENIEILNNFHENRAI